MSRVLPILFNTDMVRAILDWRKTVTRRLIKAPVLSKVEPPKKVTLKNGVANFEWNTPKTAGGFEIKMPYQPGDTMYVRETWSEVETVDGVPFYIHKADHSAVYADANHGFEKWHQSIHMPKEAARIWLKVKDVRVERLQDISGGDLIKEGIDLFQSNYVRVAFDEFKNLWNSTIKKSDLDRYGWDANPFVWVIEFERCEKPENM